MATIRSSVHEWDPVTSAAADAAVDGEDGDCVGVG